MKGKKKDKSQERISKAQLVFERIKKTNRGIEWRFSVLIRISQQIFEFVTRDENSTRWENRVSPAVLCNFRFLGEKVILNDMVGNWLDWLTIYFKS